MSYHQRAERLFNFTKMNGLEGNRPIYIPPTYNNHPNSVFNYQPSCYDNCSSTSSLSWITDLTNILSLAMTGFGLFKSIKDLFGATKDLKDPNNTNNSNQNNGAKDVLSVLKGSDGSVNEQTLKDAIDAGTGESNKLQTEIKEINTIQSNIDELEKTTIPNEEKTLEDLKKGLIQSSDSLTQAMNTAISSATAAGAPQADIDKIKKDFEDKIAAAKEQERKIAEQQKKIDGLNNTLTTYKKVLDSKTNEYGVKNPQELEEKKAQIDGLLTKLQGQLRDVQNASKSNYQGQQTTNELKAQINAIDKNYTLTGNETNDDLKKVLEAKKQELAQLKETAKKDYGITDADKYTNIQDLTKAINDKKNAKLLGEIKSIDSNYTPTGNETNEDLEKVLAAKKQELEKLKETAKTSGVVDVDKYTNIQDLKNAIDQATANKKTTIYIVQPNDALWKIAQRFNTTVDQLLKLNPSLKSHPGLINKGDQIIVPKV